MSQWDQIQNLVNQIASSDFRDNHVSISINVSTLDSGQIYVDMGKFGNSTQQSPSTTLNFLGGVLMGMNINRG